MAAGLLALCTLGVWGQQKEPSPSGAVSIRSMEVCPDVNMNEVQVTLEVQLAKPGTYELQLSRSVYEDEDEELATVSQKVKCKETTATVELMMDMGENPHLWSEFHPDLYTLTATLTGKKLTAEKTCTFAMREFLADSTLLFLNGNRTFLRGVCDGMTAVLSDDVRPTATAWHDYFTTAKQVGINHYRFTHSNPTEEAFTAADEQGIYLSVEPLQQDMWSHHPSCISLPSENSLNIGHPTDKATMESCLRDPDCSGFLLSPEGYQQLAATHDTQGWDKGLIPLAVIDSCQNVTDTLNVTLLICNYSEDDHRQPLTWQLYSIDDNGQHADSFHQEGEVDYVDVYQGEVAEVGKLAVPLTTLKTPAALRLELATGEYKNRMTIKNEELGMRN